MSLDWTDVKIALYVIFHAFIAALALLVVSVVFLFIVIGSWLAGGFFVSLSLTGLLIALMMKLTWQRARNYYHAESSY